MVSWFIVSCLASHNFVNTLEGAISRQIAELKSSMVLSQLYKTIVMPYHIYMMLVAEAPSMKMSNHPSALFFQDCTKADLLQLPQDPTLHFTVLHHSNHLKSCALVELAEASA